MGHAGRRWVNYAVRGVGILVLAVTGALLIAMRVSDGPVNAIVAGGALRAGALVEGGEVDWPAVLHGRGACEGGACAAMSPIEFQLVDPPTSRYVGIMQHEGRLYVPCDLGFMWGRFEGSQRRVLHLIYLFKRWHLDALRDGRVVLRIDGTRYAGRAVRVTDAGLEGALRAQLEEMARDWVAPAALGPPPTEGPRDIWFFRIDQEGPEDPPAPRQPARPRASSASASLTSWNCSVCSV
jgi:hypothetical protein